MIWLRGLSAASSSAVLGGGSTGGLYLGIAAASADAEVDVASSHCLVTENVRGGELFDYVVAKKGLLEREAAGLIAQIGSGLRQAHALGIAHRDLKLENVLFVDAPAPGGAVKLIDWGLSHQHAVRLDGSDEELLLDCEL